jgi:hypothetical protein
MNFAPYLNLIRPDDYGDTSCFGDSPDPLDIVNDYPEAVLYMSDLTEFPLKRMGRVDLIWENLNQARLAASQEMSTELTSAFIGSLPARQFKSATMGQPSVTQYIKPADPLLVLPIPTYYYQGGDLLIRSLGLNWSDGVPSQPVGLYAKGGTTPIETIALTIKPQSRIQTAFGRSWRVPMDGDDYELRTLLPPGIKVADNQISCCGNTPSLTTLIPRCYAGKANGWMVSISGACSYDPLFAQLLDNESTRNVLAYMLAYLTAYKICARIQSGEIDRGSVLAETDVAEAGKLCLAEYTSRVSWFRSELPSLPISTEGTCFHKQNTIGWTRNGLIT